MDPAERDRYSRQILFEGIGMAGQEALLGSHVAIAGCGALGSFHAAALARAGAGAITVIDRDYIEPSNLQRQWLFEEADAADALPKAVAAERRLRAINSSIRVRGVVADLCASNVEELLGTAGLILDGTDNFDTRYLINDFAVSRGIPWIYGGAVGAYGIVMPVIPGVTPCLRCVFPDPPGGAQPTCETAGILGPAVTAVASLQTADALKILCGRPDLVRARITTSTCGRAASGSSKPPRATRTAPLAGAASSPIWTNRAARRWPSAAATPCRFMSASGPSTCPSWSGAWRGWARFPPTSTRCAFARAPWR